MNVKKLNEQIESILEEGKDYKHARELGYSDSQDFKVGDRVLVLINGRVGTVKSNPAVDVYEVELDETTNYMPRVDRYYADDMELFNADFY
jgi:ATP-dependent exoDNAse (exonuclease V) alpha subunit